MLNELEVYCGREREILVTRELTKKFEEHIGNNVEEVISYFEKKEVLGEITIVIKGINKSNDPNELDNSEVKKELNDLISAGLSLTEASKYLAKKYNMRKSYFYNIFNNKKSKT